LSKIEVNTVEPQCGTTLTLGGSGDTVTLGSGASQSGFGRTGTVDWQTTKKTATFTAANGEGYFVDTSGGAVTMNLPSSPSAGDIVAFRDYASSFSTNNLTIGRGGSNLNGSSADKVINTNNTSMSLVYVDGTEGWIPVEEGTGFIGENYIVATGGTITTCGNFKIHTFTGPGTFTVCSLADSSPNNKVDYMVIAGGGGGAGNGGGGGAGGYRESKCSTTSGCWTASPLATSTSLSVTATGFPITVGAGGTGNTTNPSPNRNGNNSVFSTITSAAGGGGGHFDAPPQPGLFTGAAGGSGGGGAAPAPPPGGGPGGAGNTPPVSPPQGNAGGGGYHQGCVYFSGGGGGGATAAGSTGGNTTNPAPAGNGGAGATNTITGSPVGRAGGGNGKGCGGAAPSSGQCGGGAENTAGTANTGGGGGSGTGGNGGSGVVIIRYKYQ
jgi:hypothetical protein